MDGGRHCPDNQHGRLALGLCGDDPRTRTLPVAPGYEYCLSVRAPDVVGNVSPWSAERCTAMPLDDRALVRATTGWASVTSTSAYASTLTRSVQTGTSLTRTVVRVRRIAVVVTTCPTCGSVDVFLGSTRLGTLRLTSAGTRTRQVLLLPLRSNITTGTIKLRTLSGRLVLIDGLGLDGPEHRPEARPRALSARSP